MPETILWFNLKWKNINLEIITIGNWYKLSSIWTKILRASTIDRASNARSIHSIKNMIFRSDGTRRTLNYQFIIKINIMILQIMMWQLPEISTRTKTNSFRFVFNLIENETLKTDFWSCCNMKNWYDWMEIVYESGWSLNCAVRAIHLMDEYRIVQLRKNCHI